MISPEGSVDVSTSSAADTRSVAAEVARLSRGGDLILLVGDLGAGKTVFAQGFAAALGVEDRVTSPTFALVQSYEGDMVMHHLDVYRITHSSEIADLGLGELLDDDAVTLIEWGDMIVSALPNDFLEVNLLAVESGAMTGDLTAGLDDSEIDHSQVADPGTEGLLGRRIVLTARGPSWRPRMGALRSAILTAAASDGVDEC